MHPIVDLLIDFGARGSHAGKMRGAVLAACRDARVPVAGRGETVRLCRVRLGGGG